MSGSSRQESRSQSKLLDKCLVNIDDGAIIEGFHVFLPCWLSGFDRWAEEGKEQALLLPSMAGRKRDEVCVVRPDAADLGWASWKFCVRFASLPLDSKSGGGTSAVGGSGIS
jgi:hypothetical protein